MVSSTATLSTTAREASLDPLPHGWEERLTPDGQVFYFNIHNSTTTWDRPAPTPLSSDVPPAYENVTEDESTESESELGSSLADLESKVHWPPDAKQSSHRSERASSSSDSELGSSLTDLQSKVDWPPHIRQPQHHSEDNSPIVQTPRVDFARSEKEEQVGDFEKRQNSQTQRSREVSNMSICNGKSKAIWVADFPVSHEIHQQIVHHQHGTEFIRYSALTGGPSDLLKLCYALRPRDPTEMLISIDMKRQSEEPKVFNGALITTLGSVMHDLSTSSFSKDFENRCNGSPLKGVVVCIVIHEDRLIDVPWLRNLGFGFLWDLPPVVVSGPKKGEVKLYDDGHRHPRKIYGNKIMTILYEVRNVYSRSTDMELTVPKQSTQAPSVSKTGKNIQQEFRKSLQATLQYKSYCVQPNVACSWTTAQTIGSNPSVHCWMLACAFV